MEVGWTHPQKTIDRDHPLGPGLELTRQKEKSRATEEDVETLSRRRHEDSRDTMVQSRRCHRME